jgi:hypothetical protein
MAFVARTLSLSHILGSRSEAERSAWWRGFVVGLLLALIGVAAGVIASFAYIVRSL